MANRLTDAAGVGCEPNGQSRAGERTGAEPAGDGEVTSLSASGVQERMGAMPTLGPVSCAQNTLDSGQPLTGCS